MLLPSAAALDLTMSKRQLAPRTQQPWHLSICGLQAQQQALLCLQGRLQQRLHGLTKQKGSAGPSTTWTAYS